MLSLSSLRIGYGKVSGASRLSCLAFGILAFLTAKTLPLGAERHKDALLTEDLLNPRASTIIRMPLVSPVRGQNEMVIKLDCSSFVLRKSYDRALGLSYHPLTLSDTCAARLGECFGTWGANGAAPRSYKIGAATAASVSGLWVMYNPFDCLAALLRLLRNPSFGCMRLDGVRLGRVSRFATLLGSAVFLVLCVVDVVIGAAFRLLQLPYYLLMFGWHLGGPHCYFESNAQHHNLSARVFNRCDVGFTCVAVIANSLVLCSLVKAFFCVVDAPLSLAHYYCFCGLLALLTVGALWLTLQNFACVNGRMEVEAEAFNQFVRCGSRSVEAINAESGSNEQRDPSDALLANTSGDQRSTAGDAGQPEINGMPYRQWAIEERYRQWAVGCVIIANCIYLEEASRGVYLPDPYNAGFCGFTAVSGFEQIFHYILHGFSSLAVVAVESVCSAQEQYLSR